MSGIIRLLPEHVANQIAAGEVVERPSSVVKELLENSIDAGATSITLRVEQAGKALIEVTDNGKGMSPTDARMCFERHATSKISSIDDLFRLSTKGFRGEALASIASVAQVELFTRLATDTLGTRITMEGGKLIAHDTTLCAPGTRMRIKNLFFNIPARRQFLKEDSTELNHIFSEFERVALAHPSVKMELISNENLIYSLTSGNYFQRIEGLFGKSLSKSLIFFEEKTNIVSVKGYVSKPENATKKKKNQFFFVNDRFIRSAYLSRAVYDAFQGLIPDSAYPQFFIYLTVDPSTVDVNIHPTKTEVKFRDERMIYAILQSAIRRSIGKSVLSSELDFQTPEFIQKDIYHTHPTLKTSVSTSPKNISESHATSIKMDVHPDSKWKELYAVFEKEKTPDLSKELPIPLPEEAGFQRSSLPQSVVDVFSVFHKYIFLITQDGLYLADRQRMHERILFEEVLGKWENKKALAIQHLLIPEEIELGNREFIWIKENKEHLLMLGFDIQEFGKSSVLIQGIPSGISVSSSPQMLENLMEQLKVQLMDDQHPLQVNLAKGFARTFSLKPGMISSKEEVLFLVQTWLHTLEPAYSPFGKPVCKRLEPNTLDTIFKK